MKFKNLAIAMGFAGSIMLAGQAQATVLVIDDWNVTTGDSVIDTNPDGNEVIESRDSIGGDSLPRTDLMANLVSGDGVSTQDCVNCQQGHFVNDANSLGHGYWSWTPAAPLDLTAYDSIMLDYGADLDGGDLILSFGGSSGLLGDIWWKDLDNTLVGGIITMETLTAALPGGLTGVTSIFLDAFSVGGSYTDPTSWLGTRDYGLAATSLDLNVDNLKAVPEPTTLALLGLGLVGLSGMRRRRAN